MKSDVPFWETLWAEVAKQMPAQKAAPKTWGGFIGAVIGALLVLAIWFPFKFAIEIWKALDLKPKPNLRREAERLYAEAQALAARLPAPEAFADTVLQDCAAPLPQAVEDAFWSSCAELYRETTAIAVPPIPLDLTSLEAARWRDQIRENAHRFHDLPAALAKMKAACVRSIENFAAEIPPIVGAGTTTTPIRSLASNPGILVEKIVEPFRDELFAGMRKQYEANLYRVSGVPYNRQTASDPKTKARLLHPHEFRGDASEYLKGTPFEKALDIPVAIEIPQEARWEHHWVVAGSGHGKTTAMKAMLADDLDRAIRGECSIIVLDSQRQVISELERLKVFADGQPLADKLVLLDAADLEWPIAINMFSIGRQRLTHYSKLERERLLNSTLSLYKFMIGSLLEGQMTNRQSTLFGMTTQALFTIPGATIHTFRELLGPNGYTKLASQMVNLHPHVREFFETQFDQFKQAREQVIARVWSVLENSTFNRLFSSPVSKIDLFTEMNTPGKVILINAEKGLLKEGTELFGRFWIALIGQSAAERSTIPEGERLPCYVYIDECHNYIKSDENIKEILAEARQQRVALILMHQFLGQIDPPVLKALNANTSIKMAGAIDSAERPALARDLNTVPDFIRDQP